MSVDFEVKVGMEKTMETQVTEDKLASAVGSGIAAVFSTPSLIALMENAAMQAIQDALPDGWSSVGTRVEADHIAATPPGLKVRATARVIEVDRRRVVFAIEAFDDVEKVGEAVHTRFIVEKAKFESKAQQKGKQ
jgi:fluoroacetyl-CoA thioesterase